jgi:hypothetical protein
MTKKERVLTAINHKETDRIPKGELYIDPGLSNRLVGKDTPWTINAAASGGGFILSTCNILVDIIPPENAITMYRIGHEFGVYKR